MDFGLDFDDILALSKESEGRTQLVADGTLHKCIAAFRCCQDPQKLIVIVRCLRNLCAGNAQGRAILRVQEGGLSRLGEMANELQMDALHGAVLQAIGNAIAQNDEENQRVIWEICYPTLFNNAFEANIAATVEYSAMILYNCVKNNPERRAAIMQSKALYRNFARVCFDSTWKPLPKIQQWIELLFEKFLLDGYYPNFFCDDDENSIDILRATLAMMEHTVSKQFMHEDAPKDSHIERFEGISNVEKGVFPSTLCLVNQIKTIFAKVTDKRDHWMYCLRSCVVIAAIITATNESKELRINFGTTEVMRALLDLLFFIQPHVTELEERRRQAKKENIAIEETIDCDAPTFGLRRETVRLIANLCYKNREIQDLVREMQGLVLILNAACIDEDNPYVQQVSVWAIRNLTDDNLENQMAIKSLEAKEVVSIPTEIEQMGLQVQMDEETGLMRIRPNTNPKQQ